MKLENNSNNRQQLAEDIVDAWDMDDLISFATETLQSVWEKSYETFALDCKYLYGDDLPSHFKNGSD